MIYGGIDPGAKGAIAAIDEKGGLVFHSVYRNWTEVSENLTMLGSKYGHDMIFALEKQHSAGGNGVASTFSFGANYGGWLACLEILKVPHFLIAPGSWMPRVLGAFSKGDSKQASLEYVNRRWPDLRLLKKDHGISDAICLAVYALKFK